MNTTAGLSAFVALASVALVVVGLSSRDRESKMRGLKPPSEAKQAVKLDIAAPDLVVSEEDAPQERIPQREAPVESEQSQSTPSPEVQRDPRDFSWKYDRKSADEIQLAYREVSAQLGILHHKEAIRAVEGGKGEAISRDEMSFKSNETSRDSIGGAFYSEHRKSFFKVILTREEVPELLALRDEVNWLFQRIEKLQPSPFD